ncbi:MAG: hypothetical protein LBR51_04300 [Bacteroidales bacterium]|jgi:uncharacterized protein (DUF608 family)|nr:hypothetical protein [Bacteroidales bacterium]
MFNFFRNFFLLLVFFFAGLFLGVHASEGYPIANFALTINADTRGNLMGEIWQNTGTLGTWLQYRGSLNMKIRVNDKIYPLSSFAHKTISRSFPFVRNTYEDKHIFPGKIEITAFCPLSINDAQLSSLPVMLMKVKITTPKHKVVPVEMLLQPDSMLSALPEFYFCIKDTIKQNTNILEQDYVVAFHDSTWLSANQFNCATEVAKYALSHWTFLYGKTAEFDGALPHTGDNELDQYARWYMVPGISLTRCTKKGEVLTMGYCELNQRDSYWTSWLHLVFFKDLELKMIEETIAGQNESGKVPTTLLPRIEREDDLDINAFFILRVLRYYKMYHDQTALSRHLPAMRKAMNWLIARADSTTGLPVQRSFWGDWKDVQGVKNRKYSPFSCMLYIAAANTMAYLDSENYTRYRQAGDKALSSLNRDVEDGGLWNGNYYCQRGHDESINHKLLQDQMIGVFFNVVPDKYAEKIIAALNKNSLTPYGIAETYPYYEASFGYPPGTYHNGAVWPWLSFMDAWARIKKGRYPEAIDLVKRVARADLFLSGDWSPNEHINSITGENLGFQLQGWNASLFGLVYFGLLYPEIGM